MQSRFVCMSVCFAVFGLTAIPTIAMAAGNLDNPFGSPDQIASQKGTFDILGVKLGEQVGNAIKALKAYDPKLQIAPKSGTFSLLPNMKITPAYVASEKLRSDGTYDRFNASNEVVTIATTTAPSKPYIWGISRQVVYPDAAKRSLATSFISALEKKYGPPAYGSPSAANQYAGAMTWFVDKDGNATKVPEGSACLSHVDLSAVYVASGGFNKLFGLISQGRVTGAGNGNAAALARADASPGCAYASKLQVNISTDGQGRLRQVTMEAENFKLGWAGVDVTRAALLKAQAAKKQQEKNNAASQSGPKL